MSRKKEFAVVSSTNQVGIAKRVLAAVADMYISSVIANIPVVLIFGMVTGKADFTGDLSELPPWIAVIVCLLGMTLVLLYYIALPVYKFDGQTLGKKWLKFKVVKTDESSVDLAIMAKREALGSMLVEGGMVASAAYFRNLVLLFTGSNVIFTGLMYFSFGTTILSILIMLFSRDKRAIHDFIAGTKVVNAASQ